MKAKVNYNAKGTFLEPFIGHEVEVHKVLKKKVWISIDYGNGRLDRLKLSKEFFNLNDEDLSEKV